MISSLNILIPVDYDIYPHVVEFYRTALKLAPHSDGMSAEGNPWYCFQVEGITLTIHTGREGKFPYPEFRPTGHGIVLAIEVPGVVEEIKKFNSIGITVGYDAVQMPTRLSYQIRGRRGASLGAQRQDLLSDECE
ncbi:hypothetical protein R69658_03465 [Paraburkholderia aspalathi]|uniref:VOC domain-containing protein n=1 Tax=Paraburkholderia aspalathi TaxID=1324617 RepID=A0ABN7LSQ7_9BURK|nr:hypothetical protein [Paraburkholderia aspalathi]MBK3820101.1 hypothetical protein [Paraburkholderia aspalathi]MBK3831895.1 hypothetical protein [Paraburkholderia aspalathi]MBK3861660.1 hypothetical protein [Paraburkholderia aspalathi]CAE6767512.1 hypothetical protein R69658_03465 [Paraburkholderia aspalathi]